MEKAPYEEATFIESVSEKVKNNPVNYQKLQLSIENRNSSKKRKWVSLESMKMEAPLSPENVNLKEKNEYKEDPFKNKYKTTKNLFALLE